MSELESATPGAATADQEPETAAVRAGPVTIPAGDSTIGGYLAVPAAGSGPGVLVLHAWWGLNDTFRGVCDRLAEEGFVALAPELYPAGEVAETVEAAQALIETPDPGRQDRVIAALDFLLLRPERVKDRVGVLGFSMGAGWSYLLSVVRPDAVASVVTYYGTGSGDYTASRAIYLGHFVKGDSWEPDDDVEALEQSIRDAGRSVRFKWYEGASHWFSEPDRPEYQPELAALAWSRTLEHFRETLGAEL